MPEKKPYKFALAIDIEKPYPFRNQRKKLLKSYLISRAFSYRLTRLNHRCKALDTSITPNGISIRKTPSRYN